MVSTIASNLERLLAAGKDNALLRFSLGNEYLKAGELERAREHLARAVEHDPNYSAAWKSYGKVLEACGAIEQAIVAYRSGIAVAEAKGDKQAAKEMIVFSRRLQRRGPGPRDDSA